MASTRGRLLVLGGNPVHGSDALDSRMGACLWDLSLGQHTGDGKPDGRRFWVGRGCFFLGGAGEGKRNSRARNAETMRRCFAGRCEFRTALCVYVIYYMLGSGGFAAACFRPSRKVPSTSMPWAAHVRCSGFDNPSTSLRIDICEGAVAPCSASTELCVCCLCTCVLCCYVLYVYYMYMSVICS